MTGITIKDIFDIFISKVLIPTLNSSCSMIPFVIFIFMSFK